MMVVALRWDDAADCFSARQAHIMLQDKERQTMLNNTYPPRHATPRNEILDCCIRKKNVHMVNALLEVHFGFF